MCVVYDTLNHRDANVYDTPFSPRLIRTMAFLLGGCAIASHFYGPLPLIVGTISLIFVAGLIEKWSSGGR